MKYIKILLILFGVMSSFTAHAVILDDEIPTKINIPKSKPKPSTANSKLKSENDRLKKELEELRQREELAKQQKEEELRVQETRQQQEQDEAALIEVGRKIYNRAFARGCGTCHEVSSNPQLGELIRSGALDRAEFAYVIKNGRGGMPVAIHEALRLGRGLTEDQVIDALYLYSKNN